jgi:hypothetical protein
MFANQVLDPSTSFNRYQKTRDQKQTRARKMRVRITIFWDAAFIAMAQLWGGELNLPPKRKYVVKVKRAQRANQAGSQKIVCQRMLQITAPYHPQALRGRQDDDYSSGNC